ncbi:MAG TPA: DegV family protein, partial [Dehalococcoidia bacterium]|nr:DegV family protein [Dehalococcoidia bacterium]
MTAVAIIADSSACLPPGLIEQYDIDIVPLAVLLDGSVYRDGEISREAFYQRLRGGERATTAAPAPGEFLAAFRRARDCGAESVLCLTLSARYSGTYSSARKAAELAT